MMYSIISENCYEFSTWWVSREAANQADWYDYFQKKINPVNYYFNDIF